jgi:hypothetical protein
MTGQRRRRDEEERLAGGGRPSGGGNGRRSRWASDLNPSDGVKASRLTGAGGDGGMRCEKPKKSGMAGGAAARSA